MTIIVNKDPSDLVWPEDFINKIICGDCLEVMKKIPDGVVDLVLTDPPYGMAYVSSRRKRKFKPIENDGGDLTWFDSFACHAMRASSQNSHLYSFCNEYAMSDYRMLLSQQGFSLKRALVWIKNNHTSGDLSCDYGNMTEFILYANKGRKSLNGKRSNNVLKFARVATLYHPTEKPVDLMGFLIKKSSTNNDIILDPFLGSGTTAVAAKQLGRQFIGIEINMDYCKIAEDRLRQEELFNHDT